eukprot:Gregarina_sp_Poly_1__3714@NODE_209_length_11372_cov_428_789120_g186_i0_p3_GENE_NODE_209_length_11372_cov_428_789120_g186_i0NODE_209_length_11372_cov_428_789120_g186_i0_p3_ORF_typecomplete_len521_score75_42Exostosin/PF03016_15/2_4e12_NODE_209_length_11372_cov_428_789120_g186_i03881950
MSRWLLSLPLLVAGGGEHTPLVFPISPHILQPCPSLGYNDRPASQLCRPKPSFSDEVLAHIERLEVKDLDFYDVFTEAEILNWFRPRPSTTIPFYLWDDVDFVWKATLNVTADQGDQWASLYEDFKIHPWRTRVRSEAVVHFVGLPWLVSFAPDLGSFDRRAATPYLTQMMNSEEWKRFNGSNFFLFSGQDSPMIFSLQGAGRVFSSIVKKEAVGDEEDAAAMVLRTAGIFHCTSAMDLRPCVGQTNYSAKEKFRSLRRWPAGDLESFRYPLGAFHLLQQNRRYHYFFMGQADGRWAYRTRAHAVKELAGFWEPGVAARSGGGEPLPDCTLTKWTGCEVPKTLKRSAMTFERWMMDSQYGLHLRGDTFYSGRLAEVFASGEIPIIVDHTIHSLGMAGKCHQPLREMAYWISEEEWFKDARGALQKYVIDQPWNDKEKKLRLLEYYRFDNTHGLLGSKVAEDRMYDYVANCLSEEITASLGVSKRSGICPFENDDLYSAFLPVADSDDTPPWGKGWHFRRS